MKDKVFSIFQRFIYVLSRLISVFVRKEANLLLICVKQNITENHKALFEYLLDPKSKNKSKIVVLSQMTLQDSYSDLLSYRTFSLKGWVTFLKAKKLLISHGDFDYKPFKKMPYHHVVNMWHGIPLKKIGFESERKVNWDFHIVSSLFEKTIMKSSFFLNDDQIKVLGVPKNDVLFSSGNKKVKKQLLYLNTFRKGEFSKFFSFKNRNLNQINELLLESGVSIVFKLHPNEKNNPNIDEVLRFSQFKLADQSFNIQEELKNSIGLITDYSGVVFDALGVDVPVILLPYDLEKYSSENGFNRNYEEFLPHCQAYDQLKFIRLLQTILVGKQIEGQEYEKYKYYKYLDTNSSSRLIEFIESI